MKIDFTLIISTLATLIAVSTYLITVYQERRHKTVSITRGQDFQGTQKSAAPSAALYSQLTATFAEKRDPLVVFSNPPFGSLKLYEGAPATQSDLLSEDDPLDFFAEINSIDLEIDWRNEALPIRPSRFPHLAGAAA